MNSGAAPPELTGRLFLEAGRQHTLRAEYAHPAGGRSGPAFVTLSWSSSTRAKAPIHSQSLFTPDGQRGGLAGVYFASARASGSGLVQVDPQVSFDWGAELPPLLRKRQPSVATSERSYTVRMIFAEPEQVREGERVFGVNIQGKPVLDRFDIFKEAGGRQRGVIREFRGVHADEALQIEFVPTGSKPPLICGVELIAEKR